MDGKDIDQFEEKRFGESKGASVFDGAPEDAAQHVIATGISWLNAIGDGEAQGADVVGNDAEGDVDFFLLGIAG